MSVEKNTCPGPCLAGRQGKRLYCCLKLNALDVLYFAAASLARSRYFCMSTPISAP